MSRHQISVDPEVVVGWDPPLGTYFAQMFDSDGELIVSIGYDSQAVGSVDQLELWCLAVPCVSVPPEIAVQLERDRREPWEPGPLQAALGFTGEQ